MYLYRYSKFRPYNDDNDYQPKTCSLACELCNNTMNRNTIRVPHSRHLAVTIPCKWNFANIFSFRTSRRHTKQSEPGTRAWTCSMHVDSTSEAAHLLLHGSYNFAFHNFIRFVERRLARWRYVCAFDFSARVH